MSKKHEISADWQARAEAFRAEIAKSGSSISDWARRNNVSYTACVHALRGTSPCKRGEGHRAAVLMGLKDGVVLPADERKSV